MVGSPICSLASMTMSSRAAIVTFDREVASFGACFRELCWIYWNCCRQSVRLYVSKEALGTSIRNTFELHLFENGLYRKRRYMRRNQPKFGVYPDVARSIFGVFSVRLAVLWTNCLSKCWFGSIHVVYNVLSMGSHQKLRWFAFLFIRKRRICKERRADNAT